MLAFLGANAAKRLACSCNAATNLAAGDVVMEALFEGDMVNVESGSWTCSPGTARCSLSCSMCLVEMDLLTLIGQRFM